MAVNLTGMLSQINQQMAPRQPAPQIPMEQQNLMQRFGVADPHLQQFGQGLAGALGVETRSPMAIGQEQARNVYSQAMTADPQKQLELAGQLMNIQGYEKDAQLYPPNEQGTLVAFPSFVLHEITPVTKGERYSLVNWIAGPNFR